MAFHGLFNCVDLVLVGRLGHGAIAAVTVAGITNMAAMLLFHGVATIGAADVARFVGEGRIDRASDVARRLFVAAIVAGVVLGGGFALLASRIVTVFSLDDATADDARRYLLIMSLGSGAMFLLLQGTSVMRAAGDAVTPTAILIGANLVNLVLDILLIFGHWGFPALGVTGAAVATVSAWILGCVAMFMLSQGGKHGVSGRRAAGVIDAARLVDLFRRGLPVSAQMLVRVATIWLLMAVAAAAAERAHGSYGSRDLMDGVGLCIRLEMVGVFFMLGWGQAAGTVVGQNLGARRPDRASAAAWWVILYCVVALVVAGVALHLSREDVFDVMAPRLSDLARRGARDYLAFTMPAWSFVGIGIVISQALNGAGSTRTALVLDVFLYLLILLPLALVLTRSHLGVAGAWIALVAVHVVAASTYVMVFRTGRWRRRYGGESTMSSKDAADLG